MLNNWWLSHPGLASSNLNWAPWSGQCGHRQFTKEVLHRLDNTHTVSLSWKVVLAAYHLILHLWLSSEWLILRRFWNSSPDPSTTLYLLGGGSGMRRGGPNSKKFVDKGIRDVMMLISISLSNRNCCVRNCDNIPKGLALENKNLMSKHFGIYFSENCF